MINLLLPRRVAILLASIFLAIFAVAGTSASTATGVDALEPGTGLPTTPRTDTPRFIGGTVTDQTVVGNRVLVVGTFEQVRDTDGTLRNQPYFAAYNIDTGALDLSYAPSFDREVQAVEPDGVGGVIVGGKFNSIDGASQRKLARINADGDRDASFNVGVSAKVTAIAVANNRVYVGGPFSSVTSNGVTTTRHTIAAFMLADGALDTNFDFPILEAAGRGGELSVKGLAFSGSKLVVAHNGLTVDGQSRVGAAIIQTTPANSPSLLPWRTDFFKENTTDAGGQLAITNMAVAPDGSYFVIVSSGGDVPLQGRDSAVRFPVPGNAGVEPTWISRHFDSMFGVGISDRAVFVGGHFQFQEAVGSPDPFPGDPNVNYGAGVAGVGAAQLGNQVVARQQIGALDPATGKSLNWNPGATAEVGVESLVVVDRGLLVGQDGDTLGGQDIGRHGFFDITRDVAPIDGLSTSITSHFNGEQVDAGQVELTGTATDGDAGVQRVQLAILETTSKQYVQSDGSLGAWIGLDADLDTPGSTSTNWQRTVQIDEPGTYQVQAKTFTIDGRKDRVAAYIDLEVRAAGDELPNVTSATSITEGTRIVTASGLATDDRGVARVTVSVRDLDTDEYLQANGTLGTTFRSFDAELAAIDAPETSWSTQFELPRDGRYRVDINVIDTSGQDDGKFQYRNIIVALEDLPPVVQLEEGVFEVEADQKLTITPELSDDVGLASASLRIRRQLTFEGTRPDNSFGANGTWVDLGNIEGDTNAQITYQSPSLPVGIYALQLRAVDGLGQQTTVTRTISVGALGDDIPVATVSNRSQYEASPLLELSGTATDDVGVASLEVLVRNRAANRWVAPDGSLSSTPVAHSVVVDNPGATSTSWSWSYLVDSEARYQVYAIAIDSQSQRSSQRNAATANLWYTPSDALPVPGLSSPIDGVTVTGGQIFLLGRAIDDNEIDRVQIRLRRNADNRYQRSDGTWGSSQWTTAAISNPDRPETNWTWSSMSDLEAGDYRIQVRVRDNSARWVTETVTVTVAP